ncbi:MAG: hypothetical protein OXK76_03485 [Gammaproteobacteria bacterium]|nr:hypothetical protein [Gammaproteobacteria bacterium]
MAVSIAVQCPLFAAPGELAFLLQSFVLLGLRFMYAGRSCTAARVLPVILNADTGAVQPKKLDR